MLYIRKEEAVENEGGSNGGKWEEVGEGGGGKGDGQMTGKGRREVDRSVEG